jgi:hypothetical protein
MSGPNAQQQAQQAFQQNQIARQILLRGSQNMWLPVFQNTYATPLGQVINIPLRNVGLVKRIVVEVSGSFAQSAAETHTRTAWGPANIFSNVILTDLSNQTRVNTTGWHLHAIATAKRGWAWGSAYTNDSPVSVASNYPVISCPASVTTVQTFRYFMEIPVSMGDTDLRGAIYANVVNATFNLQLTVNPNFSVASTADGTLSVYKSSTAAVGTLSNMTIIIHQNFLDQLPQSNGQVILPQMDLGTAYLLNNTVVTGVSSAQDNAIPYANFRDFYSTTLIYQNFGATGVVGADISTWKLQSANYTNLIQYDPFMSSLLTRAVINDDFPAIAGSTTYYFDHRVKPVSTIQYGNMQLVFNPANVQGASTQMLVGYEALAYINQITQAGSLYNT